jgi:L-serine dehydratase
MNISVFDLFKIGLGPSSSHTVGPMRAALRFVTELQEDAFRDAVRVHVDLYGSLALTGRGHATDKAVILGLLGLSPDTVDPDHVEPRLSAIRQCGIIDLAGRREVSFSESDDIVFHRRERLPFHPNGMRFSLTAVDGTVIKTQVFYSIGGGFVLSESEAGEGSVSRASDGPVR